MLTILTFVLSAQTALAATTPFINLIARQSLTPTAACVNACTPLANAVDAGDASTIGSLCTNTVVNDYAECYDCLIAGGAVSQAIAQDTVNDYVDNCNTAGYPVSGATVSGSSSGGSDSGTSVAEPGGSETETAGESTSTAPPTGSSGGSSSGSSSSSGSNSGSSSSNKGSSGGGGGLGSGSGFKFNSAVHANVGYLTVFCMSGLSAILLQNL
ncbi:hypothetical protein B0H12DRAFT_1081096 [Mycena haematopus]|nr:hypothetical protein B0H12DRAFT_1081096 [Mycena haematopus]